MNLCEAFVHVGYSTVNFVEVMALQRAFRAGRFKCSGASTLVSAAEFPFEGYVLVVRKKSVRKFCLGCFRIFLGKRPLKSTESENYLTIYSF